MTTVQETIDIIEHDIRMNFKSGDQYRSVVQMRNKFKMGRSTILKAMVELKFRRIVVVRDGRYWVR